METAICDKKATVQHKSQALEQTRAELAALEAETSQLQLDVERTRAELAEARESVALAAKSKLWFGWCAVLVVCDTYANTDVVSILTQAMTSSTG